MSTYSQSSQTKRSYVVAGGVGGAEFPSAALGNYIVRALLKRDLEVKVLVRDQSAGSEAAKDLERAGAKLVPVDYTQKETLDKALVGVDVVVCAINPAAADAQLALAEACKRADIQLFLPAEYGPNTDYLVPEDPVWKKKLFREHLKTMGLPSYAVYPGLFAEWASPFLLGLEPGKEEANIVGDGNQIISFTSLNDVADFIAESTSTLPLSKLQDVAVGITGSHRTWNQLAEFVRQKQPELKVVHTPVDEVRASYDAKFDMLLWIKLYMADGKAISEGVDVGTVYGSDLLPSWKPKPVEDFL